MRLLLLFLAGSVGLFATTVASANCTLGLISQNVTSATIALCGIPSPTGDSPVQAGAMAAYFNVSAYAEVLPGTSPSASSDASAADTEYFRTAGPVRPGTIQYYFSGGVHGESTSFASISTTGYRYSLSCNDLSCNTGGPPPALAFGLGTVFEAFVSATAIGGCGDTYCSEGGASIGFLQLFEADGTTPVDYFPIIVPEPGPGALLWTAIPTALWSLKRRR